MLGEWIYLLQIEYKLDTLLCSLTMRSDTCAMIKVFVFVHSCLINKLYIQDQGVCIYYILVCMDILVTYIYDGHLRHLKRL